MSSIFLLVIITGLGFVQSASNSDLNFNFTGYTNVAKLLVTSCSPDVQSQINLVLGGSATINCIEMPTTNPTLPHVSCSSDSVMGTVVNFTLYKTDNDAVTNDPTRQRLEMKVFERSPANLKATFNSSYIYSWWFKLDPTLITSDKFFHIFQLKAVGTNVDDSPLATFTMTTKNAFHLRLRNDDHSTFTYYDMITVSSVAGKWVQAYVKVDYKSGNTAESSTSGSIQVTLKDQNSALLYDKLIYHNMFWPEADFVRPKWGLYRTVSDSFQSADWELFQNVQIWEKL